MTDLSAASASDLFAIARGRSTVECEGIYVPNGAARDPALSLAPNQADYRVCTNGLAMGTLVKLIAIGLLAGLTQIDRLTPPLTRWLEARSAEAGRT